MNLVPSNTEVSKPIFKGSTKKIFVISQWGTLKGGPKSLFSWALAKNVVAGENCPYIHYTSKQDFNIMTTSAQQAATVKKFAKKKFSNKKEFAKKNVHRKCYLLKKICAR